MLTALIVAANGAPVVLKVGIFLLFQLLSCLFSTKLLKLIYKNCIKDLRPILNWVEILIIYNRAEQEY